MTRRIGRGALSAAVAAVLLLTLGTANAATTSPPYDGTYDRTNTWYDFLTMGDATASTTQDVSGALSIATSARQFQTPTGVDVEGPNGKIIGIGTSHADARAGITHTVAVGAAGTVTVSFGSITGSATSSIPVYTTSGSISSIVAEASFVYYPCGLAESCAGSATGGSTTPIVSSGGTAVSSASISFSVPGAGKVALKAGLYGLSYAKGASETSGSASATVTGITAP